jgi:transmembrane sensor
MGKSRFMELMAKSMGKTATTEELAELETFLEQSPEYKKLHQVNDALKGNIKITETGKEKDISSKLEDLWNKIKNADELPVADEVIIKTLFNWRWVAAAILILGLCGGAFYTLRYRTSDQASATVMHEVRVPYGTTQKLIMADGTTVRLNAGSTFIYPEQFSKSTRDVTLTGEGFFEVTKNPKKPFLVHTNKLIVKVLGTVFNVKAYNDDKTIETTLLKGKVQVQLNNNPEKTIILLPNEKLMVTNNESQARFKSKDNIPKVEYQVTSLPQVKPDEIKETAWIDNKILFTNELFEDVAKQIERKYNVQVIFEDPALKTEQISGLLDKEPLQEAMQIIELTTPFKFRMEGKNIYLAKKDKQN